MGVVLYTYYKKRTERELKPKGPKEAGSQEEPGLGEEVRGAVSGQRKVREGG